MMMSRRAVTQRLIFAGKRRKNNTHRSTTDSDARLAKRGKGKEAKLCYEGHALAENRNGLITQCELTRASGLSEREAGIRLLEQERKLHPTHKRMTVGADKGYDTHDFVNRLRNLSVTPHIASKKKGSAIDGRTTSWESYHTSQRRRKLIEECFGWMKTVGGLRKLRHRGHTKVSAIFTFACAAYNLVRMRSLLAKPA